MAEPAAGCTPRRTCLTAAEACFDNTALLRLCYLRWWPLQGRREPQVTRRVAARSNTNKNMPAVAETLRVLPLSS